MASDSTMRASFSMDRESREAIRQVAERYGVDQGDIVNMAPALFTFMAEHALDLRRRSLPQLKTLIEQAQQNVRGISSVARHLRSHAEAICAALDELYKSETRAIEQCDLTGKIPEADGYPAGSNRLSDIVDDFLHEENDVLGLSGFERLGKIESTKWPVIMALQNMGKYAGGEVLTNEYDDGFVEVGQIFAKFGNENPSIINIWPFVWQSQLSTREEIDDYRSNPEKFRPSGP